MGGSAYTYLFRVSSPTPGCKLKTVFRFVDGDVLNQMHLFKNRQFERKSGSVDAYKIPSEAEKKERTKPKLLKIESLSLKQGLYFYRFLNFTVRAQLLGK